MDQESVTSAEVCVVIVSWNGVRWLGPCLESLNRTTYPRFGLLVVDNASRDGSADFVRRACPGAEVVSLRRNRGFAEGNNVGIRRCLSGNVDYIVLLNQDTVVDPCWLLELVRAAQANPSVGVWNPTVYDYEGRDLDAGFRSRAFQNPDFARDIGRGCLREVYLLPDAVGSALMLDRRTVEAVGLFDPIYFAYYEETDLCRRARLAGFQVGLASRSRVRHWRATAHPESMPWRTRHLRVRNEFLFTLKNPGQGLLRNALEYARLSLTRRYAGLTRRRLAVHLALTHLWMALNFPRIVLRRREERRAIEKCKMQNAKCKI